MYTPQLSGCDIGSLEPDKFNEYMLSLVLRTIDTSLGSKFNNITAKITINNVSVTGTLDTAAQITVVNNNCLQTLNLKPSNKTVILRQAALPKITSIKAHFEQYFSQIFQFEHN